MNQLCSQIAPALGAYREQFLGQLSELLAIPSVSTQADRSRDMQECAQWLARHALELGASDVRTLAAGGAPAVYAEWRSPGAPTLLVYGHYDVQPPEPLELWTSPPFRATVRDGKLFARGAADDKGQLFIHLKCIELLAAAGAMPLNVKLLIEGEEEIGSPNLESLLQANRSLLAADVAVISDSAFFADGVPSICYGGRGIACLQVEVSGPQRDLHSGSFGGSVHNPIQALAEIIARLHDDRGLVAIPGFYDHVRAPSPAELDSWRRLPWDDAAYAAGLGVPRLHGEEGFSTLERLWARPTLECNGIRGGYAGEGFKSVLPAQALAKISMRLVPDQDPARISDLVAAHILGIAPPGVRVTVSPLNTAQPFVLPLDSPGVQAAAAALEWAFGKPALYQRDGGSLPVVNLFQRVLGLDTVLLGFGVPEENAHAPDEFLKLDNFFGGIRTLLHFYSGLPAVLRSQALQRRTT